jgi:outer membrane protein TolC
MTLRNCMLIVALVCGFGYGWAQTLDSLIQEALQNNSQLRSFDYRIQAAHSHADAVSTLPPPTLGFELSQAPTPIRNPFKDAISQNFSISQMFMLGGKLSAMGEAERKGGGVVEQSKAAFEVDLRAKVTMNYLQLWLIDRQMRLREERVAVLENLARTMLSQVVTNRMRQADLLAVQAEASSERSALVSLRGRRATVQNTLAALLGRDSEDIIATPDSLSIPLPASLPVPQLAERVKQENPALAGMERMKEMNALEAIAARRELIPDLMVQAMAMRMPNGMILTGGERDAEAVLMSAMGMPMEKAPWMYSVMVSVTLPFMPWSSGKSSARVEELRVTNLAIEYEKAAMQREMVAALRSAVSRYHAADSLAVQYGTTTLPLLREAAEAQTVAYLTGQVPLAMVLDVRRMELMKSDDYLMALVDRQMALAEIEMGIGSPLR